MGMCDCDYYDDCEAPSFTHQADHKAAKQHMCDDCGSTIQPGETYHVISGKWEGHFESFKQCSGCVALRKVVFRCAPLAGLRDEVMAELGNAHGEIDLGTLDGLDPVGAAKLQEFIDAWEERYGEAAAA